jgi:hypothetical protein
MKKLCILLSLVLVLSASAFALDETEPNNTSGSAKAFNIGDSLRGGFPGSWGSESGSYWDYWSFTAVSGTQYTFAGTSNGSFLNTLDLALDLENSGGTVLASADSDSSGTNESETLVWTATGSGTFYLVVWEATANNTNAISSYTISTSQGGPSDVDDWHLY